MIEMFGEEDLVLLTGGSGAINAAALDSAMRAAESEVNGYLGGVVSLPMDTVPDVLRLHACNIAYWYLDTDNPTKGAESRYKAAVRFLERVQDGKASLGVATTDEGSVAIAPEGGVTIDAPGRIFTDERLNGYVH